MSKNILILAQDEEKVNGIFLDIFFSDEIMPLLNELNFVKDEKYLNYSLFSKEIKFEDLMNEIKQKTILTMLDMEFVITDKENLDDTLLDIENRLTIQIH